MILTSPKSRNPRSTSLEEIVAPLLEPLRLLAVKDADFSLSPSYFDGPYLGHREALIECTISPGNLRAFCAIATLLRANDSQGRVIGEESVELRHMSKPLHVVYVKHSFGVGPEDCLRYIWVNGYGDEFTLEAAETQVAHIVPYLIPANLVTLTPEELARM